MTNFIILKTLSGRAREKGKKHKKKTHNNNNNNKSGGWVGGGGYLDRRDRKRIDSRSVATSSGSLFQTATVLWRKEKLPIISSAVVYGRGKWVGTVRVF